MSYFDIGLHSDERVELESNFFDQFLTLSPGDDSTDLSALLSSDLTYNASDSLATLSANSVDEEAQNFQGPSWFSLDDKAALLTVAPEYTGDGSSDQVAVSKSHFLCSAGLASQIPDDFQRYQDPSPPSPASPSAARQLRKKNKDESFSKLPMRYIGATDKNGFHSIRKAASSPNLEVVRSLGLDSWPHGFDLATKGPYNQDRDKLISPLFSTIQLPLSPPASAKKTGSRVTLANLEGHINYSVNQQPIVESSGYNNHCRIQSTSDNHASDLLQLSQPDTAEFPASSLNQRHCSRIPDFDVLFSPHSSHVCDIAQHPGLSLSHAAPKKPITRVCPPTLHQNHLKIARDFQMQHPNNDPLHETRNNDLASACCQSLSSSCDCFMTQKPCIMPKHRDQKFPATGDYSDGYRNLQPNRTQASQIQENATKLPSSNFRDRRYISQSLQVRKCKSSRILRSSTSRNGSGALDFVNYTPDDSIFILTGVAPSGSGKTKARREKQAIEKRIKLSKAALRAVEDAGGDVTRLIKEGLIEGLID